MTPQKREEIEKFFNSYINDSLAITVKGWSREQYSEKSLLDYHVSCPKTNTSIVYTYAKFPNPFDPSDLIPHLSQKFPIDQVYMYIDPSNMQLLQEQGLLTDVDFIPYDSSGFYRILDFFKQPSTIKKKITI